MDTAPLGNFVWLDLLSPDPSASIAFYTDVLGWTTKPFADNYVMFASAQGPLGGVTTITDPLREQGVPPHWAGFVQVSDARRVALEAQRLGGRIWREPTEYPEIGYLGVIADPQGAVINLVQPPQPMRLHDPAGPGELNWSELMTSDHQAAFAFYSQLFGWKQARSFDMGPGGEYLIFGNGGRDLGGMFTKGVDRPGPAGWLYYLETANLDAALARVSRRGGRVLNGPMRVPGGARVAQLADPHGVMFALHENARGV
ncbi:MAG TPA: VOC family protein [Polyangia bacterium]|nr:VOC family protein [Polyangia bacterium]